MVKRLLSYMRTHLQTGSLSKKQLVHMAFLNLFSLNHLLPSANLDDTGELNTVPKVRACEHKYLYQYCEVLQPMVSLLVA